MAQFDEEGREILSLVGPKTRDNKQVVTVSPASEGWRTWFTSSGDQLDPPKRGEGTPILLSWDANEARGEKSCDLQFIEPMEVHDGEATYRGDWTAEDKLNFSVRIPATSVVANGGGTGNCNLYPLGDGINAIIPAAGNGAYDVDLTAAAPVPVPEGQGAWNVVYETGVITPALSPTTWALFDFPVPEAFFVRNLRLGSPLGVWDIDTYKVEWFHPAWILHLAVNKQSVGAGVLSGWILFFRRNVT